MPHSFSYAVSMNLEHSIKEGSHERYPDHLQCFRNIKKIKYPDFQAMTLQTSKPYKFTILTSLHLESLPMFKCIIEKNNFFCFEKKFPLQHCQWLRITKNGHFHPIHNFSNLFPVKWLRITWNS